MLFIRPSAAEMAFMTVLDDILIGSEYTGEAVVGLLPSVV